MGLLDNVNGMKDKAEELMNDPEKKEKIEQIAKEKNLSIEDAKAYFLAKNQDKREPI